MQDAFQCAPPRLSGVGEEWEVLHEILINNVAVLSKRSSGNKIVRIVGGGSPPGRKMAGIGFAILAAEYDYSYMMQGQFAKPIIKHIKEPK
jgi:hypothetical protein